MAKQFKEVFLRNFRKKTDRMTVDEICKILKVEKRTLQSWRSIKKDTMPRYEDLLNICDKLHCDPNYLFGYSDSYNLQYKEITEVTGLSSPAIDTLYQEVHEQNTLEDEAIVESRRIDMLDCLLSNRKAFNELMDCLIALHDPFSITMNRATFLKKHLDSQSDMIVLTPSDIKHLSEDTPENVHHKIRVILDDFIKQIR